MWIKWMVTGRLMKSGPHKTGAPGMQNSVNPPIAFEKVTSYNRAVIFPVSMKIG